jgi:hypothetical protein
VAATLPPRELTMLSEALVDAHYPKDADEAEASAG